jgi:hypothetical protein
LGQPEGTNIVLRLNLLSHIEHDTRPFGEMGSELGPRANPFLLRELYFKIARFVRFDLERLCRLDLDILYNTSILILYCL